MAVSDDLWFLSSALKAGVMAVSDDLWFKFILDLIPWVKGWSKVIISLHVSTPLL